MNMYVCHSWQCFQHIPTTLCINTYLRPAAYRPHKLCLTARQIWAILDFFWSLNGAAPRVICPFRVNPVEGIHSVASHPPGVHAMATGMRTLRAENKVI